ncbi:MAG: hypothetical protein K6F57_04680 [Candidatus Saccharibacteria bacterium]|nr:hypothetical protein [Candidatus Saccharibacteria bacterium]
MFKITFKESNRVQLNDNASRNNFQYYLVELTNKELPEIIVDTKEITSNLNLTVGSKVILMKRELNTDSILKLGHIIGGRLEPVDEIHERPIMINAPIILSSTVGEYKRANKKNLLITGICFSMQYLMLLIAYSMSEVSVIAPLASLSAVSNVAVGFFVAKRKKSSNQKIIAATLAVIGVILIKL